MLRSVYASSAPVPAPVADFTEACVWFVPSIKKNVVSVSSLSL
jgi:hypothetical protein